ncbi:MAG: DUF1405 domain-containing protein [Bacillota bacterium]
MKHIYTLLKYHWNSFLDNPWQYRYVILLLAVNIPGTAYGYYWYSGQLASTPRELWLFVPDSPLSTTLFSAVLALSLFGCRSPFLSVLAFAGCIKYGLWAVIIISHFWGTGGDIEFKVSMLWVSHLGMAAQGMIYLRADGPVTPPVIAGTALWMFINDFLDYRLEIHPYLYDPGQFFLAGYSASVLSGLMLFLLLFMLWKKPSGGKG